MNDINRSHIVANIRTLGHYLLHNNPLGIFGAKQNKKETFFKTSCRLVLLEQHTVRLRTKGMEPHSCLSSCPTANRTN